MALSLLAFICLVGAAFAGPFQRDVERRCSVECPELSNGKFDYQPGSEYVYNFKGINFINVAANRKHVTEQTGIAEIHVKDKCEMFLQMRNVQISSDTGEEETELIEKLHATPLSFSWVDGKIEHVCSSPEETMESENIKKGILSAIINTMPDWESSSRQQEVDSLGTCDTKYTLVRKQGDDITIKKEKSLQSCDNRQNGYTALISQQYSSPDSNVKSMPILSEETVVCEQHIHSGIIQRVVCKERGIVKPLSNYESFLEFEAEVQLSLSGVQQSTQINLQPSIKKDIRYHYEPSQDVETKEREVTQLLRELCPLTEGLLHPKVSKLYYQLVTLLKGLPEESIQNIYESLKSRQLCHSAKTLDMFLDALPMAGTEGSIKLMVELLRRKEVNSLKSKLWPASFALIPNPSAEAIAAVLPLVSEEHKSRPVLLGLSAMIHRVCSHRDCDQIPSVREATRILHQALGDHCSSEDDEEMVSTLKAFGNMGYLGEAESTVLQCAASQDKQISIRLAAVDAFRRYTKKVPSELTELYATRHENFEVRIAALNNIIKHADSTILKAIQEVLDNDEDEQVVAYTISLIHNWRKTSSPLKQNVSDLLQSIEIKREDVKYWENSKNIEFSKFNVPMNLGASMESTIIHTSGSKIPRSFASKMDVDLFGRNINLFEFGARAEGIEKALKKMLGMEQSSSSTRKSWFPLTSRQDYQSEKPEASIYLRTMGTEFLDLSVSDISSVGNMVQVADILNKLARGEQVDVAHSFLFLNTKLVVQSVTGRSYTFGMTGSATAGLTANGKVDILNLLSSPSNCHIEGRLRPSANLEFAATVGIHSDKSRPDIKIVTSMHAGSDLGAKLRIKDSHLAEARLDMPSEDVQFLKISTELFEVDSNNIEKPIVDQMQRKIDGCMRSLEKPLGIQICAQLETPKPLVTRRFPYTRGIGNLQLVIRKTDPSMTGYTASIEIPKHKGNSMTYRVTVDTPGSSIKRTFEANLQLKKASSTERQFQLELQSPFKKISSSGSCTWRNDLLEGSVSVTLDKSPSYSMKAVVEMDLSSSKKTLKPTLQWMIPGTEPVVVSGSVVYDEGRKQHIMIDFRSNKPEDMPFVFSGNLIKEGSISLSRSSQWKMSADLIAKTPFITTKAHSTLAKRQGQSQTLSSSFFIDYNRARSSKQSVKFTSEIHQSSSKLGATAQFESTEMPGLNWMANWDMQGRLKAAMKNDIVLKYGENQERNYVQFSQTYHHGDTDSLSEGTIAIKAPQWKIDSELKIATDLHAKKYSNVHFEGDLRYKADKHVKTSVQVQHLSQKPVRIAVKAVLEYPGRKMAYEDEVVETSHGIYEGKSKLQWRENHSASLKYKYKKLSDRSLMHHEIESTLDAPFFQSPVTQKAVMKFSRTNLQIQTQFASRQLMYSVEAQLTKKGSSYLQVKIPQIEGKAEIINEVDEKSANIDLQLKTVSPHHLKGSAVFHWDSVKKAVLAELALDAERKPSQKLELNILMETSKKRSEKSINVASKLEVLDIISAELSAMSTDGKECEHKFSVDVVGKNFEPVGLTIDQKISRDSFRTIVTYRKRQMEYIQGVLDGKFERKQSGIEMDASASIKSKNKSFEDKEFEFHHSSSRSGSLVIHQTIAKMELEAGKVHEAKIQYSEKEKQLRNIEISVKTPYHKFSEQEVKISHKRDSKSHTLSAAIEYSGKTISLESFLKKDRNEIIFTSSLKSPYHSVRDVTLHAAYGNQRTQRNAKSHLEVNGERKYDFSANYQSSQSRKEVQASFKTCITPEISVSAKAEQDGQSSTHEVAITKDSVRMFTCKVSRQLDEDQFSGQVQVRSRKNVLLDIKATKESKNTKDQKYIIKAQGQFTPISIAFQSSRNEERSTSQTLQLCKGASARECYNVKGYYKTETPSDKYDKYRKITFDIEKQDETGNIQHLCNVHYLLSIEQHAIKSKFSLESNEKKLGYDISMKGRRNIDEPCLLDISFQLPTRTIKTAISVLHAPKHSLLKAEFSPDMSNEAQKWSIQFQRDSNSRNNMVSGNFGLMHPALNKPVTVQYSLRKDDSNWPSLAKLVIDYTTDPRDRLTAEMTIQRQQALVARISSQANDLDLTVKVSKQGGRTDELYICEWSWKASEGVKKGEVTTKVSRSSSGKPSSTEISYSSSSSQLTLSTQSLWDKAWPSDMKLKLSSKNKVLAEVQYKKNGPCVEMEIRQSAPIWKNHLCITQMEDRRVKLISFDAYHNSKCLDLSLEFDPSKIHVANFAAQWNVQELKDALKSLQELQESIPSLPVKRVHKELQQKSTVVVKSFKNKLFSPLASAASREMQKFVQEIRYNKDILEILPKLPELPSLKHFQRQIQQRAVEMYEQYRQVVVQYLEEDAPEWLKELFEKVKEVVEKLFVKYCSRSSFCYKVKRNYERYGLKQATKVVRMAFQQKVEDVQKSSQLKYNKVIDDIAILSKALFDWTEEIATVVRRQLPTLKNSYLYRKVTESYQKVKHYVESRTREQFDRFMEYVNKLMDSAMGIDLIRFLAESARQISSNILMTFKRINIQKIWEPMMNNLLEKYPKTWIRERIQIQEFQPEEGRVRVQIHYPFDESKVQLLRNVLFAAKNKYSPRK